MTPNERYLFDKRLAVRLAAVGESAAIDLLKERGLYSADVESRHSRSLVERLRDHVETAEDEPALELHRRLTRTPYEESPNPWLPGYFRLFLSHEHTVQARLAQLAGALDNYGIHAFLAHETIAPDEEWQNVIEGALQSCHALTAVFTPAFHSSLWTDQEVGAAIGRQIPVISVSMGQSPYGFAGRRQALKWEWQDEEQIAGQIAKLLLKRPESAVQMTDAMLSILLDGRLFAAFDATVALLKDVPSWEDSQWDELEAAVHLNNHLKGTRSAGRLQRFIVGQGRSG